jgi:hypothetical protein
VDPELLYDIRRSSAGLIGRLEEPSGALSPLTQERIARDVQAAFADCDLQQVAISRHMTSAQRLRQVSEMNDFLRQAILASIYQAQPGIDDGEVQKQFLRRMGINSDG